MQVGHVLGCCSFGGLRCPVQDQLGEKWCLERESGLWEEEEQGVCSDHVPRWLPFALWLLSEESALCHLLSMWMQEPELDRREVARAGTVLGRSEGVLQGQ